MHSAWGELSALTYMPPSLPASTSYLFRWWDYAVMRYAAMRLMCLSLLVLVGYDRLWQAMTGYDRLWLVMTGYDRLWQAMTGYDWLWQAMTGYDWLWQAMTGYDWLWLVMTGYDRLWQAMIGLALSLGLGLMSGRKVALSVLIRDGIAAWKYRMNREKHCMSVRLMLKCIVQPHRLTHDH